MRRRRVPRAVPVFAAVVLLATLVIAGPAGPSASASATATGDLVGTVTGESSVRLAGVDVRIYPAGSSALVTKTRTHSNGAYWLPPLTPGDYQVRFSDPVGDYVLQWSGGAATQAQATSVTVAAGATTQLDAALQLGATVVGTTSWGDDFVRVPGIVVRVYDATKPRAIAKVTSDANGDFSLRGLPPVYVQVLLTDPSGVFPTQWIYSLGTSDRTRASSQGIQAGVINQIGGRFQAPGHVQGVVRDAVGPVAGILVSVHIDHSTWLAGRAVTGADGSYDVEVPTPIRETVLFDDPQGRYFPQWWFEARTWQSARDLDVPEWGTMTIDVSVEPIP